LTSKLLWKHLPNRQVWWGEDVTDRMKDEIPNLAIAKNYLGGLLLGMELLKKGAKEIARNLCTMQISFKKSIKE